MADHEMQSKLTKTKTSDESEKNNRKPSSSSKLAEHISKWSPNGQKEVAGKTFLDQL